MKSRIIRENFDLFINSMTKEEEAVLCRCLSAYQKALCEEPELISKQAKEVYKLVRLIETRISCRLLDASEEECITAVTSLNALMLKRAEVFRPEHKSRTFSCSRDAHSWLQKQKTIEVKSIKVNTNTSWGLFANHSNVTSINIEYIDHKKENSFEYGLCEEERTKLFIAGKADRYIQAWERKHPECKVICWSASRNSRQRASLITSFSPDRVEHTKLVMLWRKSRVKELPEATSDNGKKEKIQPTKKSGRIVKLAVVVVAVVLAATYIGHGAGKNNLPATLPIERTEQLIPQKENAVQNKPETETTLEKNTIYTTVARYNLRKSAGMDGEMITTINENERCYGTGNISEDGSWTEVRLEDGTIGWIATAGLAN